VEQLERLTSDQDETIRRHVDRLERSDVSVAEMTRSVTSLQTSLVQSCDLLADRERALAAKVEELESKTEQNHAIQQLLDASTEKARQLETSLVRAERLVSEKEHDRDQRSRRVVVLEADNADLRTSLSAVSSRLEEAKLQLNGARSDRKRLQNELERTSTTIEELRTELKTSREQVKKYECERQKLNGNSTQLSHDYKTMFRQLLSATRHSSASAPAADETTTAASAVASVRKLFDVQVKHEKSSATCDVSPVITVSPCNVVESQSISPAPGRQVLPVNR